ncbi:MAG TPA: VOC family protein [Polyangiaceae bacterium]|nr:VOC family protein [Polyangiaceae bacterium]
MLSSSRLCAFVPTRDTARARAFYEGVLGLRVVDHDDFALTVEAGTTPVRITQVGAFSPAPFTVLGWEVDDVDATIGQLKSRGVTFERFAGMDQDAQGVWKAPGGARIAWFKDVDGNVLSIVQPAAP